MSLLLGDGLTVRQREGLKEIDSLLYLYEFITLLWPVFDELAHLYDTYGLPSDILYLRAREEGLDLPEDFFRAMLLGSVKRRQEQRRRFEQESK